MAWMTHALSAVQENEPRWVHNALVAWWTEIRSLLVTMWRFISAPRRFGAEWADGKLAAMNPIAVVLGSATVLLPADYGLQRLLGWDRRANVDVWIELARASRPYLFAALTAVVVHIVLRLVGSRRSLTTTVGLMFYAGVFSWLAWCLGLVACYVTGVGSVIPNLASAATTLIWATLALVGAHRVRSWWCAPLMLGACAFVLPMLVNLVFSRAGLI